jgi:hypothetical protein
VWTGPPCNQAPTRIAGPQAAVLSRGSPPERVSAVERAGGDHDIDGLTVWLQLGLQFACVRCCTAVSKALQNNDFERVRICPNPGWTLS